MSNWRRVLCTATMLLLLAPAPALANHEGAQPGQGAPPPQQGAPVPPTTQTQQDDDSGSTLLIVGTMVGLLGLSGALIAFRGFRGRPARRAPD